MQLLGGYTNFLGDSARIFFNGCVDFDSLGSCAGSCAKLVCLYNLPIGNKQGLCYTVFLHDIVYCAEFCSASLCIGIS